MDACKSIKVDKNKCDAFETIGLLFRDFSTH